MANVIEGKLEELRTARRERR